MTKPVRQCGKIIALPTRYLELDASRYKPGHPHIGGSGHYNSPSFTTNYKRLPLVFRVRKSEVHVTETMCSGDGECGRNWVKVITGRGHVDYPNFRLVPWTSNTTLIGYDGAGIQWDCPERVPKYLKNWMRIWFLEVFYSTIYWEVEELGFKYESDFDEVTGDPIFRTEDGVIERTMLVNGHWLDIEIEDY